MREKGLNFDESGFWSKTPDLGFFNFKIPAFSSLLSPLWADFQMQGKNLYEKDPIKANQGKNLEKISVEIRERHKKQSTIWYDCNYLGKTA